MLIERLASERNQTPEEVIEQLSTSHQFIGKSINFIRGELEKIIKGKEKA
jgi:hypothetical protein